nr:calcium-binding protein 1-like [Saimiri boliviensis boliviensis]
MDLGVRCRIFRQIWMTGEALAWRGCPPSAAWKPCCLRQEVTAPHAQPACCKTQQSASSACSCADTRRGSTFQRALPSWSGSKCSPAGPPGAVLHHAPGVRGAVAGPASGGRVPTAKARAGARCSGSAPELRPPGGATRLPARRSEGRVAAAQRTQDRGNRSPEPTHCPHCRGSGATARCPEARPGANLERQLQQNCRRKKTEAGSAGAATVRPQPCALRCRSSSRAGRPRFWCLAPSPELNHHHVEKKAKTKTTKKRPQRATSNVFAMFDQSQIQEFKEAFNMIDQNRDGFIDKEDLHDMLASLGKNPTDAYLDAMMNEAPGPINFTMFLTMFGEKLNGTDPEDVIRNAFACFDEEATGTIQEDYLRELLTTMGDWFTDEEVDELYREAPIDKKGNFNYIEFTRILKHGAKDKDD